MSVDNKARQASIYTEIFLTDNIDYDDFLLPPNDFIREKYFALLRPRHADCVLEIGIGISSFLARAVKHYKVVPYGLDYVNTSLIAQKRNSPYNLNLCRGDGETLPYKDNSFDFVVAISVLEHFSNYDQAFKEIWRVLKPNGTCLLYVPCKDFRFSLLARFKSYNRLKGEEWFRKNQESTGHDFCRIPDRRGWKQLAVQNRFLVSFTFASDIFLDSWMMYYFFHYVKKVQSAIIRHKNKTTTMKPAVSQVCHKESFNDRSGKGSPGSSMKKYSIKRRVLGFFWYNLILGAFWIIYKLERELQKKIPLGATIYMGLVKRL